MEDRQAQDDLLTRSVLQGDHAAFGEIVTRYQNMVAAVAWRYGVHRNDIEDTVSEVFIKVYGNLHKYRPEHPFSTWLYRLAVNHVIDRGRRAKRERGRVEMPEQIVDESPGAQSAIESEERVTVLRAAIDDLDPRYREALFLVYVEGLNVEQVTRVLEIPEGTVKTRLMRGRQALKKILVRRHPEHFGT